jgi:DNA invertase Pin-like site-specific DNA recombinase
MPSPNVTIIPATLDLHQKAPLAQKRKKRAAGYARVSSGSEEQESSFEAQVDYYTKMIQEHPDWEFIGIYADEAVSGLSIKNRPGFKSMVQDALDGKIDLILTKSVSRLSRNTVDNLNAIRALKEKGVEIRFEKENINSLDGQGELLLTIMASMAQEESRSLSLNVTWGQRKRMQDGKVTMPYKRFLGYEKGPDGRPRVVEREAKIIRQIYTSYLSGMTIRQIAAALTEQGIPTPGGKTVWSVSTIKSILTNENYKGEARLQKTFCEDYLTKRMIKNEGQIPSYYVENSHVPIVSIQMFEMVQQELAKNALHGSGRSNASCFSGKVRCAACDEYFSPKTWHSTDPYKKRVWQCNGKYRERRLEHCQTPHLPEEQLQAAFVCAFNDIVADRERYIANMEPAIALLTDCSDLDNEAEILAERAAGVYAQMEELVADNARRYQDQDEYRERYAELNRRYEVIKARQVEVGVERQARIAKQENMRQFLETVRQRDDLLMGFDEPLWRSTVEEITVRAGDDIRVRFRDGREVRVGT